MKRLAVVSVALTPLLLLAGCGDSTPDPEPAPSESPAATDPSASDEGPPTGEISDEDVLEVIKEGALVLPLAKDGSLSGLPASNDDGMTSADAPVTVQFDRMECAPTIPGAGFTEAYEAADFVAAKGKKACALQLAVTNDAREPVFFSSANNSTLLTSDGMQYSVTDQSVNGQGVLNERKLKPSFTSDMIQPGDTKFDFVIYEIPADAEPDSLIYVINVYEE